MMSGPYQVNGHGPGSHAANVHSRGMRRRMPTVDEALPYSPFASIIPFDPALIPPPHVAPHASSTAFGDLPDVEKARKDLERLSAGAQKAEDASKRCQELTKDIQGLLQGSNMTQFRFKRPRAKFNTADSNSPITSVPTAKLSGFGKVLYNSAKVKFRCDTSETKVKTNVQKQDPWLETVPNLGLKTVKPEIPIARANLQQKYEESNIVVTPKKAPIFVQPMSLTPAQRAEYQHFTVAEPTQQHRINGITSSRAPEIHRKGDAAVENLQSFLSSMFEAEDHMQQDTSGVTSNRSNPFFTLQDTEAGTVSVLLPEQQSRLDLLVQKVCNTKRLSDIETGHLARVLQICETVIIVGQAGSLMPDGDMQEQDVDEWSTRIIRATSGTVATRTVTSIMSEGHLVKELQSEEAISNVLQILRLVTETCIVPMAEERPTSGEKIKGVKDNSTNPIFTIAVDKATQLQGLVQATRKGLKALGDLLMRSTLDESTLSSLEYMCKCLIFAENATHDRDAAFGLQTFEALRQAAMDVLCKIFTKYTDQRDYILQEILTSLEKLPATKQSARQYRMIDAKPIQLVSALLMRLVQTSALPSKKVLKLDNDNDEEVKDEDESDIESSDDEDADFEEDDEMIAVRNATAPSRTQKSGDTSMDAKLRATVGPLHESAKYAANYIISMLLQRALATTKSSDEPFRKLLDIFTDDFLNVLTSSDWPAAELLLRFLVIRLITIIENSKSLAPARSLALELLGTIGSGILDTQASTRSAARSCDTEDGLADNLLQIALGADEDGPSISNLTAADGPFRVVLEYLQARSETDAQLQSARDYHLMQWAYSTLPSNASDRSTSEPSNQHKRILLSMVSASHSEHTFPHMDAPSTATGKLAAKIIASQSLLSKAFPRIFNVILASMNSEQPTIRSRALKSVYALLEKDSSIIERNGQVLNQVYRSMSDPSSLVRDSALSLLEKCVSLQPQLQSRVYDKVLSRVHDTAIGVRKRAIKFLKLVYLNDDNIAVRQAIATAILGRLHDHESSVVDIARETIDEIWFAPFRQSSHSNERSVWMRTKLQSFAALLIGLVGDDKAMEYVLVPLLRFMLLQSKAAPDNIRVTKILVEVLFDGTLDSTGIPGQPDQRAVLYALTIFAKAGPTLFTATQLEQLEPYTKDLSTHDDLAVYSSATTVLHYAMPHLTTSLGTKFLENLQTALLKSINLVPTSELEVVAPCLWEIDKALKNTDRLVNFVGSAAAGVYGLRDQNLADNPQMMRKIAKLLAIVGQFGKACDLQQQLNAFRQRFPWYKGSSVAGLLIDIVCRFTSPKQPMTVREAAIEAVCAICQTWPEHFLRTDVVNAMETVFRDKIPSLELILLTSLEVFFSAQEAPVEGDMSVALGSGIESGSQRLGGTYKATEDDKASTAISQRFLSEFLRLALASVDETAMSAARIVVSINRQGRAHPRESGPGLVALETCPMPAIAKMAFVEHKNQYAKHESVYEKELIRGIQQAFDYQQSVTHDTTGYTGSPPTSKLHLFWEVLKTGKAKVRTKFFTNLCAKLDFDPSKLGKQINVPSKHLLLARFCLEAVAFFDFDRVEELTHLLTSLEKTFAGTGTSVAQAIESEVLKLHLPTLSMDENGMLPLSDIGPTVAATVSPQRLYELAVSSQILSLLWETRSFLRRLWNMQKHLAKHKGAAAAKESSRAPTRATNATILIDAYIARMKRITEAGTSEQDQQDTCRQFLELMNVDNDVRVGDQENGEDEGDAELGYGSDNSRSMSPSAGPRGKKRKPTDSAFSGGPKKRGRAKRTASFNTVDDGDDDDDGEGWI